MPLPHNEFYNDAPVPEAISSLRKEPLKDVLLAVSKGFGDDGDDEFDSIYEAYETFFEQKRDEIALTLGKPAFEGDWTHDSYPVFAIGDRIATWGEGDNTIYLRLYHEDEEAGIEVSLLTPKSRNSNQSPTSIYEENRKFLKSQQPQ